MLDCSIHPSFALYTFDFATEQPLKITHDSNRRVSKPRLEYSHVKRITWLFATTSPRQLLQEGSHTRWNHNVRTLQKWADLCSSITVYQVKRSTPSNSIENSASSTAEGRLMLSSVLLDHLAPTCTEGWTRPHSSSFAAFLFILNLVWRSSEVFVSLR